MANPPFNVDLVDAERIKGDPRLPFGLPGVNKQKKVGNGNYLWISYFWSYLNEKGRAGFVMSSQASSAGHGEKEVRRKIVWLQDRSPRAELQKVPGLVRLVDRKEIEAADWSLTPGRYVGVAPQEVDEDFDFEQKLRDIHTELADLNKEAVELAAKIQANFEELGI